MAKHSPRTGYDAHKEQASARQAEQSRQGRDIGPPPGVVDQERRDLCELSLNDFLHTYFPNTFSLPSCPDQVETNHEIERCIRHGGQVPIAEPRGFGKTSRIVRAALWALLYGVRKFVVIVAANDRFAGRITETITRELMCNPLLAADFPLVTFPIIELENVRNRQGGQLSEGEPTLLKLTTDEIVFPTMKGSKVSGSIVRSLGLSGAVRGQSATTTSGETIRPDLVLLDDPQTRDSAKSPTQTDDREALIKGDVLGLAGPKQKIACLMACTVIYPGDLSDRFLDAEKNPSWGGRRLKMLKALPKNLDLWDQYADVRRASQREYRDNRLGNNFYANNRTAMDEGAVAAWPERFDADELSAVQNAMNIRIDRPEAFAAEYQNEPLTRNLGAVDDLTPKVVLEKCTRVPRGVVPGPATRLTAFIDCGKDVLWYVVAAWDEAFGGSVVEYGTFPDQNRLYFSGTDIRTTVGREFPGVPDETALYKAITALSTALLDRVWLQDNTNAPLKVERLLVDSGWETDTVLLACRQSPFASLIHPSKGYAIGPDRRPMAEWPARQGERAGDSWRLSAPTAKRGRLLTFDPNFWKSFVVQRLATPFGVRSCLAVYGDPKEAHVHQMFADHLTAEYRTRTFGLGREVDEWALRPGKADNHWFDGLVGCAVAASVQGLRWNPGDGTGTQPAGGEQPKKRRTMAEAYEQAQRKHQGG